MRILNICVVVLLVLAASYVYEIKFESTLRAERVAKMRSDVRRERDAIAALRAEWATLDNPARIQGLARRHLKLGPADATQFDKLDRLPERPPQIVQPPPSDAIADKIESTDPVSPENRMLDSNPTTGSVPDRTEAR
jgi:cell division protein FtsL